MIATYTLLTAAVLSLWLGGENASPVRRLIWLMPFAAAVTAGLVTGTLRPIAMIWIGAFSCTTAAFGSGVINRRTRAAVASTILLLAGGLMAHRLPGFNNPLVIAETTFSPDAIPFRLHLNFDKTLVGLLILGFCHPRMGKLSQWRRMALRVWPVTAGMIGLLLILSLTSGYVRFDPKFPAQAWLWIAVNLCFTCVAEEALFRGFIQAGLQRTWQNVRHGPLLALLTAAVLFGVAHAAGGIAYVILATIAGAGYGWAYARTGRIEASILTHFLLNATHFFFFTYPAVQRVNPTM